MDDLLNTLQEHQYAYPIAYADDLVVIILGNSRRELEQRAADIIRIVERWTARQELQLSMQKKNTGRILRRKLDPRRPPNVRIGEGSLCFVQHLRYLGVTLHTNLKIDMHVQEVSEKANLLFQALARPGGQNWGCAAVMCNVLYKSLYQQVCAYAVHGWARGFIQRHKKKLLAAQRKVLIRATKAYATTSTACLPVVAGVLPIGLYLERRIHLYRIKGNQPTILGEQHLGADMYEDPDGSMVARNMVDAHLLQKWQTIWDTARTGRHTYEFFPNVRHRLKLQVDQALPSRHAAPHRPWFIQVQVACLGTDKGATATNQRRILFNMCCTHVPSTTRSAGHCRMWRNSEMSSGLRSFASGQRRTPTRWYRSI